MANRITKPTIYIVSGGVGASGEQVVYTVLAQFPDAEVSVATIGNVRDMEQIEAVLLQAQANSGLIVHTLVDGELHKNLIESANKKNIPAVDLMGDILAWVKTSTGHEPAGSPGLYRKLHQDYFKRVESIEYTMKHDDGKHSEGWHDADIILTGVSRVGKTPLSLYLSVLGWKVANIPYVPGIPLPEKIARRRQPRVIGLTMEPGQLLLHRRERQNRLGVKGISAYTDPSAVYAEVDEALITYQRRGFPVIDVTDKPIETSAEEVIRLVNRPTYF